MATVQASVPTTALSSNSSSWRNRIYVMNDGYRVLLYTDGTNLKYQTSQNGSSWNAAVTAIAGVTSIPATLCAVVAGSTLVIMRVSGASVVTTTLAYSGSGVFGTPATGATYGLSSTPGSITAAYDPNGTTSDSQHTAGAKGIIHLLCDFGTSWQLLALDLNTAATKPKQVATVTQSITATSPTYNTNIVLRVSGGTAKLFVLSYTGSSGWKAVEFTYGAGGSTGIFTVPTSNYWYSNTAPSGVQSDSVAVNGVNTSDEFTITSLTASNIPPGTGTTTSYSWDVSGQSVNSGTWTWQATFTPQNIANTGALLSVGANVYRVDSGSPVYIGALTPQNTVNAAVGGTLTCSGTLTGWAPTSGRGILIAPFFTASVTSVSSSFTGPDWAYIQISNRLLITPPNTFVYSAGSTESPSLPAANEGAALAVSDSTADPGIDVFLNDAGTIRTVNRTSTGSYSSVSPLGTVGSATANIAPTAARNTVTGNEIVCYQGASHIQKILRTLGAWGTNANADTSATAIQSDFVSASDGDYGVTGAAVAYVNGAGPNPLIYEDAGFGAGAATPSTPTLSGATLWGYGPYVSTSLAPTFRTTYNVTTANDKMGFLQSVVVDATTPANAPSVAIVSTAGAVRYDYKVTFVTPTGESLPSAAGFVTNGNATLNGTTYNALTSIPLGPADCTARKIWRSISSGPYALIATLANNTTVIYNDQSLSTSAGTIPSVGPTVWDSGITAISDGAQPGGTYDFTYNSLGAAATALAYGHDYTAKVRVGETIGGNVSAYSSTIALSVRSAPTVTSLTPITITSATPALSFVAVQAEGVPMSGYQIEMVNAQGGVDQDTGFIMANIAAGSTVTPAFRILPTCTNPSSYMIRIRLFTNPTGLPPWQGLTGTIVTLTIATAPAPNNVVATWEAGTTPLTGGRIKTLWTQPGINYITNGDVEITSGTGTLFTDAFYSLNGWDTLVASPTVSANTVTFPAGAAIEATNAAFYRNFTWRARIQTPATPGTTWNANMYWRKDASNWFQAQQVNGTLALYKSVAGSVVSLGSVGAAISGSTWYWLEWNVAWSGTTATLTLKMYADSSGVLGTQIGSTNTQTDSTLGTAIGTVPGYLRVEMNAVAGGKFGGLTDGTGCVVSGALPSGWTTLNATSSGAFPPSWFGYGALGAEGGATPTSIAVHAANAAANTGFWVSSQATGLTAGLNYTLSCMAKADATRNLWLQIDWRDSGGSLLSSSSSTISVGSSGWVQYSMTTIAPANAAKATLNVAYKSGQVGTIWMDKVQFEAGSISSLFHDTSVVAAKNRFFQRETGTSAWALVNEITPPVSVGENGFFSVKDFKTYDIAVSSVSTDGFESARVIQSNIGVVFKYGLWINQASSPTTRVEVGRQKIGENTPEWTPTQDADDAELFDREKPVTSIGTLYYYTSSDIRYTLEKGYEDACFTQLEAWSKAGTTLQVRDYHGFLRWCRIIKVVPGIGDASSIRTVTLAFKEVYSGDYSLLGG